MIAFKRLIYHKPEDRPPGGALTLIELFFGPSSISLEIENDEACWSLTPSALGARAVNVI